MDEAIDKEKSDINEYASSYDTKHLVFKEGETPTYFIVNNVGSTELVEIQQDHFKTELPQMVAGMTAAAMKNMKVKVVQVKTGEMLVKYFKAGCKKYKDGTTEVEIDDEVLDTIPPMVIQEIGSYIMGRSILTESKKK